MRVYAYLSDDLNVSDSDSFLQKYIGYNYQYTAADTGEDVLDALHEEEAPVIVFDSDTTLPSVDVQNVVELIKQAADVDIIVVGAAAHEEEYPENITFVPWRSSSQTADTIRSILRRTRVDSDGQGNEGIAEEKRQFYNYVTHTGAFKDKADDVTDVVRDVVEITRRLRHDNSTSVLDIGCGWGRMSNPLARIGFEVVGVDISEEALEEAREMSPSATNPVYRAGNMLDLNDLFDKKSFDAALLLWNTLSDAKHKWQRLLSQAHYVLKHHGVLLLDMPRKADLPDSVVDGTSYTETVDDNVTYEGYIPDNIGLFTCFLADVGFEVSVEEMKHNRNSYLITARKIGRDHVLR